MSLNKREHEFDLAQLIVTYGYCMEVPPPPHYNIYCMYKVGGPCFISAQKCYSIMRL